MAVIRGKFELVPKELRDIGKRQAQLRGNGGVSKILQNDVLGSGFHAPSGSDLVGTRPWRRACNRALAWSRPKWPESVFF